MYTSSPPVCVFSLTMFEYNFQNSSSLQGIGAGECKEVEEKLRSTFQCEIGAKSVGEAVPVTEGVTFNSFKNLFQASIKLDDQAYIKEFKTKADAEHWIDIIKALHSKKLLQGHFDTLKKACANREATQKAYDSIINAKNVFTPESQPTWQYDPKNGKDTWATMFPKVQEVEEKLPRSKVYMPSVLLEDATVRGFQKAHVCGDSGLESQNSWVARDPTGHT